VLALTVEGPQAPDFNEKTSAEGCHCILRDGWKPQGPRLLHARLATARSGNAGRAPMHRLRYVDPMDDKKKREGSLE